MDVLNILPMEEWMLDTCAEIAATAPDPWTHDGLAEALKNPYRWPFVALQNGLPAGFAIFFGPGDSADLEQLVVAPQHRRKGIAAALLAAALPQMMEKGYRHCLLEVRESNTGAIALYQKLGFRTLARRPGMYRGPLEDGFLMAFTLCGGGVS